MSWSYTLLLLAISTLLLEGFRLRDQISGSASSSSRWRSASPSRLFGSIAYRNLRGEDIEQVGNLCSETFDGPFQWYQFLDKQKSINTFQQQFSERYDNFVLKGFKHSMVVAVDPTSSEIVGFLEIGRLPRPLPKTKVWMNETIETRDDVPYIGNVVVQSEYRRASIGSKLLRIAFKVAQKWEEEEIFVMVDPDNSGALAFYDRLGFATVLDERDLIARNTRRSIRVFLSKELAQLTDDRELTKEDDSEDDPGSERTSAPGTELEPEPAVMASTGGIQPAS
jgi:ribosomal protein S18 acetylase RimI-like enzyme